MTTRGRPLRGPPDDAVQQMVDPAPGERTTDRDIKLEHAHSSFYYWFATTHVVSEVKHHKLARDAGARPSLAVGRARAKAWMTHTGMRLDPALSALEGRARRLVSAPIGGPAGLGS